MIQDSPIKIWPLCHPYLAGAATTLDSCQHVIGIMPGYLYRCERSEAEHYAKGGESD